MDIDGSSFVFIGGVWGAGPSGRIGRSFVHSGHIWTVWRRCVCGNGGSVRRNGRTSIDNLPTSTGTVSHLKTKKTKWNKQMQNNKKKKTWRWMLFPLNYWSTIKMWDWKEEVWITFFDLFISSCTSISNEYGIERETGRKWFQFYCHGGRYLLKKRGGPRKTRTDSAL